MGQDTVVVNAHEERERQDFARIPTIIDLPNLIEVQQKSYARFLQQERPPLDREDRGLEAVFRSVLPITTLMGPRWNMRDTKLGCGNQRKVSTKDWGGWGFWARAPTDFSYTMRNMMLMSVVRKV